VTTKYSNACTRQGSNLQPYDPKSQCSDQIGISTEDKRFPVATIRQIHVSDTRGFKRDRQDSAPYPPSNQLIRLKERRSFAVRLLSGDGSPSRLSALSISSRPRSQNQSTNWTILRKYWSKQKRLAPGPMGSIQSSPGRSLTSESCRIRT